MVRVGGGWMALDEFLVKNDPCRGKEITYVKIEYHKSISILYYFLASEYKLGIILVIYEY